MTDLFALIRKVLFVPLHPAGFPFIGGFAAVTFILFFLSCTLGWIGVVLTLWCIYFFRNPKRVTPTRPGLIVSPADGIVSMITQAPLPPELAEHAEGMAAPIRVSVFLNVFDVHVNRIPVDGEITKVVYHPGKFLSANLDKASEENERSAVLMKMDAYTGNVAFVQIAGLVARRILCKLTAKMKVRAGSVYGLIRFGSRVDVFLPDGVVPLVCIGQRMIGGETVIADLAASEEQRTGEDRG